MSDNLTVFGTDFTGVTGIKATGTGNGTLTYIRPQGTKSISANGTGIDVTEYASVDVSVSGGGMDIPTFTVTLDSTFSTVQSVTCDKTLAECRSIVRDDGMSMAVVEVTSAGSQDEPMTYTANCTLANYEGTVSYCVFDQQANPIPIFDLDYQSDSVIETVMPSAYVIRGEYTENGTYEPGGYIIDPIVVDVPTSTSTLQSKTATPTTSQQTITPDSGYDGLSSVTVSAMPTGTAGTPTATKGTVSNHSVSVTPSVTNTTGYITGGTKTGTAVSVSASELVSGTYTVGASGTHDVTNYASASVAAGGATASATKGSVSNHSITVTPNVTRTAGYVTAGTASGTAVTVSASELVSDSQTKTANGTYDVTNLASLVVAVPIVTYYTSSSNPTSSQGSNGDIWLVTS